MIIQFNVFRCQRDYSIHLINIVYYTLEFTVLVKRIRKNKGFSINFLIYLPSLLAGSEEYKLTRTADWKCTCSNTLFLSSPLQKSIIGEYI